MKPYKSVGYKTGRTKLSIVALGVTFLIGLNYFIFRAPQDQLLLVGTGVAIVGYSLYRLVTMTKNILYEFTPENITIHYGKNKTAILPKDRIARVRKIMRTSNYIGISQHNNVITKEKYFTTSKQNMICIYMRDQTNIIISPRVIKKWILSYYDSPKLIDRF